MAANGYFTIFYSAPPNMLLPAGRKAARLHELMHHLPGYLPRGPEY